jgi:hypothetical protein
VPRTLLKVRSAGDGTPYRVGGIMGSAIPSGLSEVRTVCEALKQKIARGNFAA